MNIAVVCGLIILALLVVMLLAGVPIAVALMEICLGSVIHLCHSSGAQYGSCRAYRRTENFFRHIRIQPSCHSIFHSGGKYHE